MPGKCKIAILADMHFDPAAAFAGRPDSLARPQGLQLLKRAVRRLNNLEKPDVTLVLGDLIAFGKRGDAADNYLLMRQALDKLAMPWLAIPGNRDAAPRDFYRHFPDHRPWLEAAGTRFLPFCGQGLNGGLGRHRPADLERLAAARQDWSGFLVAVQHVPLLPPGHPDGCCQPEADTEAAAALRQHGFSLVAAGHYHVSLGLELEENVGFCVCPMLSLPPFGYQIVELKAGRRPQLRNAQLAMPASLRLTDTHAHTEFAYCGRDMNAAAAMQIAGEIGLDGLVFSEHSGQLYYNEKDYWNNRWYPEGLAAAKPADRRLNAYLQALDHSGCPGWSRGLEIDCDSHGRPVVAGRDLEHFRFRAGGLHHLPSVKQPTIDHAAVVDEFMGLLERFIPSGIQVLTHPLRIIHDYGVELPEKETAALLRLLRENRVAAEINFHRTPSRADFVRRCVDASVRLTLGSDAHSLPEVGELAPHLRLLEECGCGGNLEDILLQVPR